MKALFQALEAHALFQEKKTIGNFHAYIFSCNTSQQHIFRLFFAKYIIDFHWHAYRQVGITGIDHLFGDMDETKDLLALPDWAQQLVQNATTTVDHQTRLRKLFTD